MFTFHSVPATRFSTACRYTCTYSMELDSLLQDISICTTTTDTVAPVANEAQETRQCSIRFHGTSVPTFESRDERKYPPDASSVVSIASAKRNNLSNSKAIRNRILHKRGKATPHTWANLPSNSYHSCSGFYQGNVHVSRLANLHTRHRGLVRFRHFISCHFTAPARAGAHRCTTVVNHKSSAARLLSNPARYIVIIPSFRPAVVRLQYLLHFRVLSSLARSSQPPCTTMSTKEWNPLLLVLSTEGVFRVLASVGERMLHASPEANTNHRKALTWMRITCTRYDGIIQTIIPSLCCALS